MRTLREAETIARAAIARRKRQERTKHAAERTQDAVDRLHLAQDAVDARKRRDAAVQAVLQPPHRLHIRNYPGWLDTALAGTIDNPADYYIWRT